MIRRVALVLLVFALCACGGGGGDGSPSSSPGTASSFAIASSHTGFTYTVQVWLPPGYDQGTARLPVVYAMDSEYRYAILSGILLATRRNVILVNVGAMGGDRRYIDFTMPGADAYYRFVTLELIPRIESQYRADPLKRTLSGHSLSGLFTMYALYLERPESRFFASFIAGDGSFWYTPDRTYHVSLELAATMERQMYERSRQLPVALVLAGDSAGNGVAVANHYQFLAQRGYEGARIKLLQYSIGHVAMDGPSFTEALDFIYGPAP